MQIQRTIVLGLLLVGAMTTVVSAGSPDVEGFIDVERLSTGLV